MKSSTRLSTKKIIRIVDRVEKLGKKQKIPRLTNSESSLEEKIKFSICKLFVRYLVKNDLKAIQLAKELRLPKTRLSDILNYKTENYSVDRLLKYAWILSGKDPETKEHLNLTFEVLSGPVRSVKDSKNLEKVLLKQG